MDNARIAQELMQVAELVSQPRQGAAKFMDWRKKIKKGKSSEGSSIFADGYSPYVAKFGNYLVGNLKEWFKNATQSLLDEGKGDPMDAAYSVGFSIPSFTTTGQDLLNNMVKKYTDERMWSTYNIQEILKEKGTPQELKEAKRLTKLLIKFQKLDDELFAEQKRLTQKLKYGDPL